MDKQVNGIQSLLTEGEVSKFINVCLTTLWRWRRDGIGPKYQRIGRMIRYRQEDVQAWIDSLPGGGK